MFSKVSSFLRVMASRFIPAAAEEVQGNVQAAAEEVQENVHAPADEGEEDVHAPAEEGQDNYTDRAADGGNEGDVEELPDGYYKLEAIRKKRIKKGKSQYLVKWVGWPESDNTWEPLEHLELCADVVEAFEQRRRSRSGKKKSSRKRKRSGASTSSSLQPASDQMPDDHDVN